MAKKVFISYRRSDTQMTAGRLHDALVGQFGAAAVFRDKEAIRPGHDWLEEIQRALSEDTVVIALIGPQWTGSRDSRGRRRLDDPQDTNRLELELALAKKVPLIPVLVEGASIPEAGELPPSLEPLRRRHAIRLRDDDWDADFSRLARAVGSLGETPGTEAAGDSSVPGADVRKRSRFAIAGTLLAATVAAAVYWAISSQQAGRERSGPPTTAHADTATPAAPTTAPGPTSPRDFVVAGDIIPESGAEIPSRVAVAIYWGVDRSGGDTAFQDSNFSFVDPGTGKLGYSIAFSEPPSDAVLMDIDGVKLGVGYILAFGDLNANGILEKGEPIVGGAADNAVTYLRGDIRSVANPAAGRERNRLYTLLSLPEGYALTRRVPPEQHGFPVGFDDLVPVKAQRVTIVIPKDKATIKFPNWT